MFLGMLAARVGKRRAQAHGIEQKGADYAESRLLRYPKIGVLLIKTD